MKAMILAAGLGTRMRPLTDHTPKPLLTVAGKSLIEYHLLNLRRAGIQEVIVNLAHLGEKIRQHLGDGSAFDLHLRYSTEPEPLETGGAILHARELLGTEPFLLINGDVWCDLELADFLHRGLQTVRRHPETLGYLMLVPNPAFHPQGDFALTNEGVLGHKVEHPDLPAYTFGGVSLLQPGLVLDYPHQRRQFPLVEAFRHAISAGRLQGELYAGDWSDVGTPERLQALNAQFVAS